MFFDLPEAGERALLIHCAINSAAADRARGVTSQSDIDAEVDEFVELARSAGVTPIYIDISRRASPTARFFIGAGKVDELAGIIADNQIDVVLCNHALSPSQERNLEEVFQCRVLDRTGLILDIFAQRARSHAGKLQVELAQLEHISTRLIRGWTHLERQKGGIGLRGPGETQLETDRRLLRERIKWINQRLGKVNQQRQQGRRARQRAELPTVALVGYTNAGKSTLFNTLTEAHVYAEDQLFATLDTTLRSLDIPGFGKLVLADTVGFVRELPHKLVEAFKATLEEAAEADLLLHVVDASAEQVDEQIAAVNAVLDEIGAGDIPRLIAMNKIDQLPEARPRTVPRGDLPGEDPRVWLSAKTGDGIALLKEAIAGALDDNIWQGSVELSPAMGRLRGQLYELGAVEAEQVADDGSIRLQLRFRHGELRRLFVQSGAAERLPGSDFPDTSDHA